MAIIFHPHALQRMDERGVTRAEVRRTLEIGQKCPARFGRRKYEMSFSYRDIWRSKFYEHKHLEVYCVDEEKDTLVITVVVKYF
ncbi:MAG: DUF4258 domain-containing protein [Candidatus Aminicenantales bacterium]